MRYLLLLTLISAGGYGTYATSEAKKKNYVPKDHYNFKHTYPPADLAALSMLAYKESKARAEQPVLARKGKVKLLILLLLGFEVLFYFPFFWMSKLDDYLGLKLVSNLNSQVAIQSLVLLSTILSYFIICYCAEVLLSYDKAGGFISEGEVITFDKKDFCKHKGMHDKRSKLLFSLFSIATAVAMLIILRINFQFDAWSGLQVIRLEEKHQKVKEKIVKCMRVLSTLWSTWAMYEFFNGIYKAKPVHVEGLSEEVFEKKTPKTWRILKILTSKKHRSYQGVLFVTEGGRMVLANQGSKYFGDWLFTVFLAISNNGMRGQVRVILKILHQVIRLAKKHKCHSICFTGHSLGGWLSQLFLFFAVSYYADSSINFSAQTFESPGAKLMMQKINDSLLENHKHLEDLDNTTYLSLPNIVTVNYPVSGTLYKIPYTLPGNLVQHFMFPLFFIKLIFFFGGGELLLNLNLPNHIGKALVAFESESLSIVALVGGFSFLMYLLNAPLQGVLDWVKISYATFQSHMLTNFIECVDEHGAMASKEVVSWGTSAQMRKIFFKENKKAGREHTIIGLRTVEMEDKADRTNITWRPHMIHTRNIPETARRLLRAVFAHCPFEEGQRAFFKEHLGYEMVLHCDIYGRLKGFSVPKDADHNIHLHLLLEGLCSLASDLSKSEKIPTAFSFLHAVPNNGVAA